MPMPAPLPPTDPLSRFTDGCRITGGAPLPLAGQRISVRVTGGLATVTTERRFRNAEAQSIEATLTFPVPIHATLLQLEARIGTRRLVATAQPREAARATYEAAIDEGKTAVLHEEVLRGVHILSVGHIAPGTEIAVTDCWALPLSADGDALALRIPTTVGEIYGRSPLAESDDLLTDASVVHEAEFEIVTESGTARLLDALLDDGRAKLRLDRPVRIEITGVTLRPLQGLAADGRAVTLSVTRAPDGRAPLDATLLIDRSGSMNSLISAAPGAPSKFDAVKTALRSIAGTLQPFDALELWQFAQTPERALPAAAGFAVLPPGRFVQAVEALRPPGGGTELGAALGAASAEPAGDVVLVTDGMSHALDVQALARTGKRFTVVLVGSDALEANVGHLAALSGGQLFAVADAEVGQALLQAVASLRTPYQRPEPIEGRPVQLAQRIGGMLVEAEWHEAPRGPAEIEARAVGALAASLALPRLDRATATALAAAEGIVCHLTSLVLVDEAGEAQEGLPAQRKIALMAPAPMAAAAPAMMRGGGAVPVAKNKLLRVRMDNAPAPSQPSAPAAAPAEAARKTGPGFMAKMAAPLRDALDALTGAKPREPLPPIDPGWIDWSQDPEALRRGDVSGLAADIVLVLTEAAGHAAIQALANRLGIRPMAVAIALLAARDADSDRNAARIFRAVLGAEPPETIAAARQALGW
jgi:hypothetical protein